MTKKEDKKKIEPAASKPGDLMATPGKDLQKTLDDTRIAQALTSVTRTITEQKHTDGIVTLFMTDSGRTTKHEYFIKGGVIIETFPFTEITDDTPAGVKFFAAPEATLETLKSLHDVAKKLEENTEKIGAIREIMGSGMMGVAAPKAIQGRIGNTWREEVGEQAIALLPPEVIAFLELPVEVQFQVVENIIGQDLEAIHTNDAASMWNSSQHSKRMNGERFLSLEYASATLGQILRYESNIEFNKQRLFAGVASLADMVFRLNNRASQFGYAIVIPDYVDEKIKPYHLFADAIAKWMILSNDKSTDFSKHFVGFQERVGNNSIVDAGLIKKFINKKTVNALIRNWHHFIAEDNTSLSCLSEINYNTGRVGYSWGKAPSELLEVITNNPILTPLYEVQRKMLNGEMKSEKEKTTAALIKLLLEAGRISTNAEQDTHDISFPNIHTETQSWAYDAKPTQQVHPSVLERKTPFSVRPSGLRTGTIDDISQLTPENYDQWLPYVIEFVSACVTLRRSMYTRRDENLASQPMRSIRREKAITPNTQGHQYIPYGGRLTPKKILTEFISNGKKLLDLRQNYHLSRVGLEWSALLDAYQSNIDGNNQFGIWDEARSSVNQECTPLVMTPETISITRNFTASITKQREYYTRLMNFLDAAIARQEVHIYDIVLCAGELIVHTLNLASSTSDWNNSLVMELSMQGAVIDEMRIKPTDYTQRPLGGISMAKPAVSSEISLGTRFGDKKDNGAHFSRINGWASNTWTQ